MKHPLEYPLDAPYLLRKKKTIRRELLAQSGLIEKKIAVLGGSTTSELVEMLELFLLKDGIRPRFYESDYNRYYEDVIYANPALKEFSPDIIYIHTTSENITRFPSLQDKPGDVEHLLSDDLSKFEALWDRISADYQCVVIQNNFELPHFRVHGNIDSWDHRGRTRYVLELNRLFSENARSRRGFYIHDINYLSAMLGLDRWYDKAHWYSYKYAMSYDVIPHVAFNLAGMIRSLYGKSKKCLVLDLDNTLWGGVIGDDGVEGIMIGRETPEAEAFSEFQRYVLELRNHGIILAVCSKNEDGIAREGLSHPDSSLALDDFAAFYANWSPKPENIKDMAAKLDIGMDSMVFVDDNAMERELVRAQLPMVSVPDIGSDIARYIDNLERSAFFEMVSLSEDDLSRSGYYRENFSRNQYASKFESYDAFLESLEMVASIAPFDALHMDRIAQLTNKTNQFNLTTRRYTVKQLESIAECPDYITLYCRLKDRFGDNGLISLLIGRLDKEILYVDLWLMSCRVLRRGVEYALLDALVEKARERGIASIMGYYLKTAKNGMVSEFYKEIGFEPVGRDGEGNSTWRYNILSSGKKYNQYIKVAQ